LFRPWKKQKHGKELLQAQRGKGELVTDVQGGVGNLWWASHEPCLRFAVRIQPVVLFCGHQVLRRNLCLLWLMGMWCGRLQGENGLLFLNWS